MFASRMARANAARARKRSERRRLAALHDEYLAAFDRLATLQELDAPETEIAAARAEARRMAGQWTAAAHLADRSTLPHPGRGGRAA